MIISKDTTSTTECTTAVRYYPVPLLLLPSFLGMRTSITASLLRPTVKGIVKREDDDEARVHRRVANGKHSIQVSLLMF